MKDCIKIFPLLIFMLIITACPYGDDDLPVNDTMPTKIYLTIENLKCNYKIGDTIRVYYDASNNDDFLNCNNYEIPIFLDFDNDEGLVLVDSIDEFLVSGEPIDDSILREGDDYEAIEFRNKLVSIGDSCIFEANYVFTKTDTIKLRDAYITLADSLLNDELSYFNMSFKNSTINYNIQSFDELFDCDVINCTSGNCDNAVANFTFRVTE